MQRKVPGEEPSTRLLSKSQIPEAHCKLDVQHPPTGVLAGSVEQEQLPAQIVLPGHPRPPATVYIDIKEKHDTIQCQLKG